MPPTSSKRTAAAGKSRRPRRRAPTHEAGVCIVPDCGRPSYARGLCQTHHRQLLTTGELKAIRPYRKRSPGTVKFSGLRLTAECASQVEQYARAKNLSLGAAIAYILEEWLVKKGKK